MTVDARGSLVADGSAPIVLSQDGPLVVPEAAHLFRAEFERSGPDLYLRNADGPDYLIPDYFANATLPDLTAGNGAVLAGHLVGRLAGPLAPGQEAFFHDTPAVTPVAAAAPIGQVEKIAGVATAQRADGTRETLDVGSYVFQNDVLRTEAGGTVSVTFADGTIFSLSEQSRMVLDMLIYDPDGVDNAAGFNLIEGSFVFIAGQVAKTGDMEVRTPTATMGIRGTTVKVDIQTTDGITTVRVSLNPDPDGSIGQIELRDLDGNLIAIIDQTDTAWVVSSVDGETREVPRGIESLNADEFLLLEAASAFQLAQDRIAAGESFVDLQNLRRDGGDGPVLGPDDRFDPEPVVPQIDPPEPLEPDPIDFGPGDDAPGLPQPIEARLDDAAGPFIPQAPRNIQEIAAVEDDTLTAQITLDPALTPAGFVPASYALSAGAANGNVVLDTASGTFIYTPDADFAGTDTFTVTVTGQDGTELTRPVQVTVAAVNDAPAPVDDAVQGDEDTVITGNVLTNDTDVDGDALSVTAGTFATLEGGSVTVSADGSFAYTPPAQFAGQDSFTYIVSDGALSETATVIVTVVPVNDPPVALRDAVTVDEDTQTTGNVRANDTDPEGDPLTVTAGTFVTDAGGSVTFQADGSFVYTPLADFAGTDSVSYSLSDGTSTVTGVLALTVTPVNDAPEAFDDVAQGPEETPITGSVLGNDTDVDGDPLSVVPATITTGQGGTFELRADGSYTYTPPPNFSGQDSATYTVTDGTLTDSGQITFAISNVNDPPVAGDDTASGDEDTVITGLVLGNDTDPEGQPLSVTPGTFATQEGGSVTIQVDGTFSYTPAANFFGTDQFSYTVSDGALSDTGTVTLEVRAVNDAPVAVDDASSGPLNTQQTGNLLTNDTDLEGDALSAVAGTFTTAQGGTVEVFAGGFYRYTPVAGFSGTDSFDYTVTDGTATDTGTVTLTVTNNGSPVAVDDTGAGQVDAQITGNVLTNDTDPEGDALSAVAGTFTTAQGGSVELFAGGFYRYTPPAGFTGTDSFDYTVTDGLTQDTGTVTLTVTQGNQPPVAVQDDVTTGFGQAVSGNVLTNDSDPDNDPLSVTAGTFTSASGGTLVLQANGAFTYTPAAGFSGRDAFQYTLSDGTTTAPGLIEITVAAGNTPPNAVDDTATGDEDSVITGNLLANDSDADNDPLTVTAGTFETDEGGEITVQANGDYEYVPGSDFNGTDQFTYTVSDGTDTRTATLTLTLTPVNDAPFANADTASTTIGAEVSGNVLDNDTDVEGDALSVTPGTFSTAQNGTITLAADGAFTYTPDAGFSGTDTVDYIVSDGALTSTGTLTITVSSGNLAPNAQDDFETLDEDTDVFGDVLANDSDPEGDALTVQAGTFTTLEGGLFEIASDGTYTYTPDFDFFGFDEISYTVSDGVNDVTALVTFEVLGVNDPPIAQDDSFPILPETILGGAGDDFLITTRADDFLSGDNGGDQYFLGFNGGYDIVQDDGFGGTDIVWVQGYSIADTEFGRMPSDPNSLSMRFGNGDRIDVIDALDAVASRIIEEYRFTGSGTIETITAVEMRQRILALEASSGNDSIVGWRDNDTLSGGAGDDYLSGGVNSDVYLFSAGDGQDVIEDAGVAGTDRVVISGYTRAQASFSVADFDDATLVIDLPGGDRITLAGGLGGGATFDIEEVVFDDQTLTQADLQALIVAQYETAGDDQIIGLSGDNTLSGGAGQDFLTGANGSDVYQYAAGDGADTIEDNGFGTDELVISGYSSTDATFAELTFPTASVLIDLPGGDSVTLLGSVLGAFTDRVETVRFEGDGVTLSMREIRDLLTAQQQTAGDDEVRRFESIDDTLEGGLGDDYLSAGDGGDTYLYAAGDGADTIDDQGFGDLDVVEITGYASTDVVAILRPVGDENSILIDLGGGDSLYLRSVTNQVSANRIEEVRFLADGVTLTAAQLEAQAVSNPGPDDDTINGSTVADTIVGGAGDDLLGGGAQGDTYVYSAGDGSDTIDDGGVTGTDRLQINGIASTDVSYSVGPYDAGDLVITLPGNETIYLVNGTALQFQGALEEIVFTSDGVTVAMADLRAQLLVDQATAGDDSIVGYFGDDVLTGGGGRDFLQGGDGSDVYRFNAGDGQDTIRDRGGFDTDVVEIVGVTRANTTIERVASDSDSLLLRMPGGDTLYLANAIGNDANDGIEELRFVDDALTLTKQDLRDFVLGEASTAGDDSVQGFLTADTLEGGTGDDFMSGLDGSDLYIINAGDGHDVIRDFGGFDTDRVQINGFSSTDAVFERVPGDIDSLLVRLPGGQTVRLIGAIDQSAQNVIEELAFSGDGVVLTPADLRARILSDLQTGGNDRIEGFAQADTLAGGAGDDFLSGGNGADTYIYTFGDGNDTITELAFFNADTVQINGVASTDVVLETHPGLADTVILRFSNGESLTLINGIPGANNALIEEVVFTQDGVTLTGAELAARLAAQPQGSPEDADIIGNLADDGDDFDIEGDPLEYEEGVFDTDQGGVIDITIDGDFIYTPPADFSGIDTYTYTVSDGTDSETAEITFLIAPINDPPSFLSGTLAGSVTELSDADPLANRGQLLAFGTIPYDDPDTADVHSATVTAGGADYLGDLQVTLNPGGGGGSLVWSFEVFDGELAQLVTGDTLTQTYTITLSDGAGATTTQTVTMTLNGTNDAPGAAIFGTPGDDSGLIGTGGNDVIHALAGDDVVAAGAGDDAVFAGAGDDVIEVSAGADSLYGGDGADLIALGTGPSLAVGGAGDDTIRGGSVDDTVQGSSGNDVYEATLATLGSFNGGNGRDILDLQDSGAIDLSGLAGVTLTNLEAIDLRSAAVTGHELSLSIDDVFAISDTGDSVLEALLGRPLAQSLTVYGESDDTFAFDPVSAMGISGELVDTNTQVTDTSTGTARTLNVYEYQQTGTGNVLATLAVEDGVQTIGVV